MQEEFQIMLICATQRPISQHNYSITAQFQNVEKEIKKNFEHPFQKQNNNSNQRGNDDDP